MKLYLILLPLVLFFGNAFAQTTALPVTPGYSCAPAGSPPCPISGFIPYGPSGGGGGGSNASVSATGSAVPSSATLIGGNQSGTLTGVTLDASGNVNVNVAAGGTVSQGSTTSGQGGSLIMGAATTSAPSYTTGQTSPISLDLNGNVRVVGALPSGSATNGCAGATVANTLVKPFSNAGSASNLLLVSGTAAQKIHVCSIIISPVFGAVNLALVEGTTTTNPCDTSTLGLLGGATAATGMSLQSSSGLAYGNGIGTVAQTSVNANNVCLLFSAGVQVSGELTYVSE